MTSAPSFPLSHDLNDRPISVYDNITSNPITNAANREYPKPMTITNGDPLKNISFKFDDCNNSSTIGNGATGNHSTILNHHHQPSSSSSPLIKTSNTTGINSTTKSLISSNTTPGVNCSSADGSKTSPRLVASTAGLANHDPMTNKSSSSPRFVSIGNSNSTTMSNPTVSGNEYGVANDAAHSKPVISDAKSRFFGLTSPLSSSSSSAPQQCPSSEQSSESYTVPLLNDSDRTVILKHQAPEISPTAAEHKYQNIPSNSAIFRRLNDHPSVKDAIDSAALSPPPPPLPIMPTIVTTDLSTPEGGRAPADFTRPKSEEMKRDRRRNTNSFHADTDLNYNQQPSQVIYMSTTVPQNIKSPNIAGRHTPTRNSLRHSRMLVVNKTYTGLDATNPLGLKHPKLARALLIVLLILGLIITGIGIWILLWAPYTRMQDNPYWSGLSLILASTLGLIVIKFRRIQRQKVREHCFTFLKVDSMMLTLIACILCLAAFTCASLHLHNLFSPTTKCASTNMFIANASCICIFGANDTNFSPPNGTRTEHGTDDLYSGGYEFYYRDLSCSEVSGAWRYILMASIVLNVLGFFIGSCYLILACFKKTDKRKIYTSVRTDVF